MPDNSPSPTHSCSDQVILPCVAGLILAGGAGVRMGGAKPFRTLAGKPLLDHAITNARQQCQSIMIASNDDPAQFSAYGYPVIADIPAPDMGPMAGILSGLQKLGDDCDWLAVFAVDCPFLPPNLVGTLYQALADPLAPRQTPAQAAPAAQGAQSTQAAVSYAAYASHNGRDHFLASLWHRNMAPMIASLLDQGQSRVRFALQQAHATRVDFPATGASAQDALLFANINTPDDIARVEDRLAARPHRIKHPSTPEPEHR
ncbi:molybdenum cofactor guanylyltransferase [Thalassospira mesophila]|uniref:molybdenum cofactor guanylyltransferase n=1 Tax=Thalassospira mesophila TaxID=1293891 RepID=UPI000A1EF672|nr:molybdenum cofactor guanylyltransferase [Thalassospira mesophila]